MMRTHGFVSLSRDFLALSLSRIERSPLKNWWWSIDHWTLWALCALALAGLLFLTASSPSVATRLDFPTFHFVEKQITFMLSALGIMTFLAAWDDYLWPFLVMSSESKFTLTIALSKFAFKQYTIDYGPVIAGSVVSIMPVALVYILLQRYILEGISLGGVKG